MKQKVSLSMFFNPQNIAIVGASNNPQKAGYVIVNNLIKMKYPGKVFPVNKKEHHILGLKAYGSLSEIPDTVELVVLITPSAVIQQVMADVEKRMQTRKDIKGIVCAAAGYAEVKTEEGIKRQQILMDIASKHNIRVIGPNCIGIIDNQHRVDTTFAETLIPEENRGIAGGISFVSQSGAIATSILMWGASLPTPFKFNKFISVGNMADIDFIDLLEYLEQDETTKVIGIYLEGYPRARKLIETMGRITTKKPVVVLKVGRSSRGAAAANSHTGSLAGEDRIYESAFRQFGVIRVDTIDEMMDTLRAFDQLPLPRGNRLFLFSQAGGPGIFCMDTLSQQPGITFPEISQKAKKRLRELLPPMASICTPEGYCDISASADVKQHVEGVRILMEEPVVDAVLLITVVPTFLPRDELAAGFIKLYREIGSHKPLFPVIMAGNWVKNAREKIERAGLPTFETPDRAARAAANLIKYSTFLSRRKERGK